MLDIGWMELLIIGIVALVVVGPKDLPKLFRNVGQVMGKARGMAREFQRSMEQAADDSGLKDAARDLNAVNRTLNTSTGSARRYADGLMKETGRKPDGLATPPTHPAPEAVADPGPAGPARPEPAPEPAPQPSAERVAGEPPRP